MRVLLLFEGDPECVDPKDEARLPRRHYDEIPPDADVILIWRETIGNPDGPTNDKNWPRWHLFSTGVFENLRMKDFKKVLRKLGVA